MELLLLRSASRNFPIDLEPELTTAGYKVNSLPGLHAYIACPARSRPQLLVLEIGTLADLDRALVVLDWNEHVQPLAPTRYLLLMASKHLSLGDRAARLASAEIAVLPQPMRNLLFKLELQTRLLRAAPPPAARREAFASRVEELPGTSHRRVLVLRGPSPEKGSWNRGEGTPSGKVRWRWVKSPGLPPDVADQFQWHVDSRTTPQFDSSVSGWITEGDDDEVACELGGETIYSMSKNAPSPEPEEEFGRSERFVAPSIEQIPIKKLAEERTAQRIQPGSSIRDERSSLTAPNAPEHPFSAQPTSPDRERRKPPGALECSPDPQTSAERPVAPEAQIQGPKAAGEAEPVLPVEIPPTAATMAQRPALSSSLPPKEISPSAASRARAAIEQAKSALNTSSREKQPKTASAVKEQSIDPIFEAPPSSGEIRGNEEAVARKAAPMTNALPAAGNDRAPAKSHPPSSAEERALQTENIPEVYPRQRAPLPELGEAVPEITVEQEPFAAENKLPQKSKNTYREEPGVTAGRAWIEANAENSIAPKSIELGHDVAKETSAASPIEAENTPLPPLSAHAAATEKEEPHEKPLLGSIPESTGTLRPSITSPASARPERARNTSFGSIGSVVAESDERGQARPMPNDDDARRFLKTRHFQLMTLEQLGDRDSSWHPMGHHRIYLSAQHRYYGLKDPSQALPIWIYDGELAPEFIDEQRSWKFYDCLPVRIDSLAMLPSEAFEALYRLCGLEPPMDAATSNRGNSVIFVEAPIPEAKPEATSATTASIITKAPEHEGAWRKIKRTVRGIFQK